MQIQFQTVSILKIDGVIVQVGSVVETLLLGLATVVYMPTTVVNTTSSPDKQADAKKKQAQFC